jgi:hypothetical protein
MQVVKTAGLQTLPAAKITVSLTEITLSQPILALSKKLQIHTFNPPHFSKRLPSKMLGHDDAPAWTKYQFPVT